MIFTITSDLSMIGLMKELNSQQRSYLTKEAHKLKALVQVGQKGVTPSLINMVNECLDDHELIKIKFQDFKGARREKSEEICASCKANLIRVVGNVAIIYRQSEDSEKQKYNF